MVTWIIDSADKAGIMEEITNDLHASGAALRREAGGRCYAFDAEKMKLLLESKCVQSGVRIQLHAKVVAALREGRRLTHVITEDQSGRRAWAPKVAIDTTGDGNLAVLCGCNFDVGHPETGKIQPMSMCALVTGIRFEEVEPFVGGGMREPKLNLLAEMERAGLSPSRLPPIMMHNGGDVFSLIANHEYGIPSSDAAAISEATVRARNEIHTLVDGLKQLGGVWQGIRVVATSEQIGIREGRRIHGRYRVSLSDLIEGARHDDAVCRVTSGIDVHPPVHVPLGEIDHKSVDGSKVRTKPYDIPLRALIARDVDGLMMAGRCISGDFFAHSSYRMTGNAVAMGEATGKVAAIAAATDRNPHEVAPTEFS